MKANVGALFALSALVERVAADSHVCKVVTKTLVDGEVVTEESNSCNDFGTRNLKTRHHKGHHKGHHGKAPRCNRFDNFADFNLEIDHSIAHLFSGPYRTCIEASAVAACASSTGCSTVIVAACSGTGLKAVDFRFFTITDLADEDDYSINCEVTEIENGGQIACVGDFGPNSASIGGSVGGEVTCCDRCNFDDDLQD